MSLHCSWYCWSDNAAQGSYECRVDAIWGVCRTLVDGARQHKTRLELHKTTSLHGKLFKALLHMTTYRYTPLLQMAIGHFSHMSSIRLQSGCSQTWCSPSMSRTIDTVYDQTQPRARQQSESASEHVEARTSPGSSSICLIVTVTRPHNTGSLFKASRSSREDTVSVLSTR